MPDAKRQLDALLEAAADATRPPLVMGVLNVTPDSFADGGRYADPDAAVAHGLTMAEAGADVIDVGGESTRPGAKAVSVKDELDRVIPVIRGLAGRVPAISIDTRRAAVAEAALDAGALIVNDVSAFRHDPEMTHLLGRRRPAAVAMHMRGVPEDMATRTGYRSLVADCATELWASASRAVDAGLPLDHLMLDPGIGFAKDSDQSLALLANLDVFVRLGRPVVVGVSRKSFIGRVLGRPDPSERLFGTAGAVAVAVVRGARVLRVHDVAGMRDVAVVAHAIARAGGGAA
jgi:dihydropteroate synthase